MFELIYSPPSPILGSLIARATEALGVTSSSQNNAVALENELRNQPYLAGIQFDDSLAVRFKIFKDIFFIQKIHI